MSQPEQVSPQRPSAMQDTEVLSRAEPQELKKRGAGPGGGTNRPQPPCPLVRPRPLPRPPQAPEPKPASLLAGKYLLVPPPDSSSMHSCIDVKTGIQYSCRVVDRECRSVLEAHYRLDGENCVNRLEEVVLGQTTNYLVFGPSHGDLHAYVRGRRRLREPEARKLFRQVTQAVAACHEAGLVLRDLKLRKFVFKDQQKTEVKLESLEDAVVLQDDQDDLLQDKRGCPAYVSPEILRSHARYSGRAADLWSLGVILYTMLVGRYPFNDPEHMSLFYKISRCQFVMPEGISSQGRCLIRSLLRREPSERLSARDVLLHPWFSAETRCYHPSQDQIVPSL